MRGTSSKWNGSGTRGTVRRFRLVALAALLTAAGVSCAHAPAEPRRADSSTGSGYPVTIASCGHTSTLTAPPSRAISLNQGATEILLALGLESRMVGTAYLDDTVSPYREAAYASVPVLAKGYPSHETVTSVQPDFIYASYASAFDATVAGTQAELAASGVASYLSPFGCPETARRAVPSFDAVWTELSSVAEAFGVPERAAALRVSQQRALDEIARTAAGAGRRLLWLDGAGRTPTVGAGGGGPQLAISAVGATNVYADAAGGWADGSWETIIAADPDVIVLADAAWDTAEAKLSYLRGDPVLSSLRAVRQLQIVTVPFSESTPGVRLVDGAKKLSEQLGALEAAR